jgi:hypothetical protein
MLCFYLLPYFFLQRTLLVSHIFTTQIFFYTLYFYRFSNIYLFGFYIAEYIDCVDETQCQEKYKCAPHLDLKCVDTWCHCLPK